MQVQKLNKFKLEGINQINASDLSAKGGKVQLTKLMKTLLIDKVKVFF